MGYVTSLVSQLNVSKVNNASRLLWSYYNSRRNGRSLIKGLPMSVSIEPTTACNLGCTECPSGLRQFTRETGNLDPEFYDSVLEQLSHHIIYLTFYFQGEPYINKHFFEMVRRAADRRIFTSTSTNGHFLDEENVEKTIDSGLSRLIISIDGTDQGSYEKYRVNGNLEKVIEGVKQLEKRKKSKGKGPFTEIQFIVFKHNEHQMSDMKKLFKELGSDKLVFKTAQLYQYETKSEILPDNKDFSRYQEDHSGELKIKNKLLDHCWRMWHSCVITWDGKVVPCCFDKDAKHVLGDLKEESFEKIWFGDKYESFRNKLLKSRSEIDICTNCTEGTKVWI